MRLASLVLPCLLFATGLLAKPTWDPVPSGVWAMKDSGKPGDTGASFVKAYYHFTSFYFEYQVRIRIYSERGKAAASWPSFPLDTWDLEGRTVYPDGKEVPFNSTKDFHILKTGEFLHWNRKEQVVVPPGLTADCVVELKYKTRRWLPEHSYGRFGKWQFAEAFPVETLVVEVPKDTAFAWNMKPGSAARRDASRRVETPGATIFTLTNLPALPEIPYSLRTTLDSPSFIAYSSNFMRYEFHDNQLAAFWANFAREMNTILSSVDRGRAYRAFSETIRKDLPGTPIKLASELATRLSARIRNTSIPTFQEAADKTRSQAEEKIDPRGLDAAVKRGATNSSGFIYLYLHLLQDAGIHPKLAFATDRDVTLFSLSEANTGQFESEIFGIEEAGQPTLWVSPFLRFATPGLILPQYQGTPALVLDTATWTTQVVDLPLLGPQDSLRHDAYRLEVLEDEDHVSLETEFAGDDEFEARWTYQALEPGEQNRQFKEALGTMLKDFQVGTALVENATDPARKFRLKVDGRIERTTTGTRTVVPFPLTPGALYIPQDLPATRKELIVLPEAFTRTAECTFKVPAGFQMGAIPPFVHSNLFGDVSWKAEKLEAKDGPEIKVTLMVRLNTPMAEGNRWPQLVTFLGWVQEAQGRTLVLEKNQLK